MRPSANAVLPRHILAAVADSHTGAERQHPPPTDCGLLHEGVSPTPLTSGGAASRLQTELSAPGSPSETDIPATSILPLPSPHTRLQPPLPNVPIAPTGRRDGSLVCSGPTPLCQRQTDGWPTPLDTSDA